MGDYVSRPAASTSSSQQALPAGSTTLPAVNSPGGRKSPTTLRNPFPRLGNSSQIVSSSGAPPTQQQRMQGHSAPGGSEVSRMTTRHRKARVTTFSHASTKPLEGCSQMSAEEHGEASQQWPVCTMVSSPPEDTLPLAAARMKPLDAVDDLLEGLNRNQLGHCHGILHAAGIRRFSELEFATPDELRAMECKPEDSVRLQRITEEMTRAPKSRHHTKLPPVAVNKSMSSSAPGSHEAQACPLCFRAPVSHKRTHVVFVRVRVAGVFEVPFRRVDFMLEPIFVDGKAQIYKGRFFNVEQCLLVKWPILRWLSQGLGNLCSGVLTTAVTTAVCMHCADQPHGRDVCIHEYGLATGNLHPHQP